MRGSSLGSASMSTLIRKINDIMMCKAGIEMRAGNHAFHHVSHELCSKPVV